MKTIHLIFLFAIGLSLLTSCDKPEEDPQPEPLVIEGSFSGTFTKISNDGTEYTNPVTVTFNSDGSYNSTASYDRVPAGGSGTFTSDSDQLHFQDEGIWTADFDWNLILNGSYSYTFDGTALRFEENKNGVGDYIYDLVKDQ